MAEKDKDELVTDAEAIGEATEQLLEHLANRTAAAASEPVARVTGATGVQPMTAEDIPESGR